MKGEYDLKVARLIGQGNPVEVVQTLPVVARNGEIH
jgi:hypothetical protein